ncbi:protein phosphatase 1 regulatory subunit 14A-like isoform X2 [Anas acuta]|uniref:protein phosphatase 1 regulatory subunit 14A-like isoform X2 n=1 Tax=Anas acuta TaxID=28680 RepID=UPI0035C8C5F0
MAASGSGRGGRGRSPGPRGAQARPRPPRLSPGPPPRRQARVTVRYDRRQLQRRLDTERWIDGRLGELYRGREAEMPDEVNIDDLLELPTDEERAQRLQGILKTCTADTQEDFPPKKPKQPPHPGGATRGLCTGQCGESRR